MHKVIAWILAVVCVLAAFSSPAAKNTPKSLIVLNYSNISMPCSGSNRVTPAVFFPAGTVFSQAFNRHGPHLRVVSDRLMGNYSIPGAILTDKSVIAVNQIGNAKDTAQESYAWVPIGRIWAIYDHKDWTVTDLQFLPPVDPISVKVSQSCY